MRESDGFQLRVWQGRKVLQAGAWFLARLLHIGLLYRQCQSREFFAVLDFFDYFIVIETLREVARIQSFPENFKLVGSEHAQYRALGNAIAPVMFWYVANEVNRILAELELKDKEMQTLFESKKNKEIKTA